MICQTCSTWQIKTYETRVKKQTKDFGLLLKQGKVTISIKALTKVGFFARARPWDEKSSVFMEMQ